MRTRPQTHRRQPGESQRPRSPHLGNFKPSYLSAIPLSRRSDRVRRMVNRGPFLTCGAGEIFLRVGRRLTASRLALGIQCLYFSTVPAGKSEMPFRLPRICEPQQNEISIAWSRGADFALRRLLELTHGLISKNDHPGEVEAPRSHIERLRRCCVSLLGEENERKQDGRSSKG